jgi:hypothetical protein
MLALKNRRNRGALDGTSSLHLNRETQFFGPDRLKFHSVHGAMFNARFLWTTK